MSDRDVTCVPDDYTVKLMTEVERLQGENAKLRELLGECAALLTNPEFFHWAELCDEVLNEMHELGIEVKADEAR